MATLVVFVVCFTTALAAKSRSRATKKKRVGTSPAQSSRSSPSVAAIGRISVGGELEQQARGS